MSEIYLSIIVPVFNEEKNLAELHSRILATVKSFNQPFEIIFVNDGSRDQSLEEMKKLSPLKIISFRKNYGQTAAIDSGIKAAQGLYLVTLDADMQNHPEDIPLLFKKMKESDADAVCGWRFYRQDSKTKKFVSRGANWLRKYIVNDGVHDSGCTLKLFKRECFENLDLFGEMHRFIPALLRWRGFKVTESIVKHDPRLYGETRYNWKRIIKGFLDMIGLWFWQKYSSRPLHLFGFIGLTLFLVGGIIMITILFGKLFGFTQLMETMWLILGIFYIIWHPIFNQWIIGGYFNQKLLQATENYAIYN